MREETVKYKIKTIGPVHIGDGEEINKKEYVRIKNQIQILDIDKFIKILIENRLFNEYEKFIFNENSRDLFSFLKEHKLLDKYKACIKYSLNNNINPQTNTSKSNKTNKNNNIKTTIKDAYLNPYIPATSIKGALMNAIYFILSEDYRDKLFKNTKKEMENILKGDLRKIDRNLNRLDKDILKKIENEFINIEKNFSNKYKKFFENKRELKMGNLVHVSDSTSLSCKDLILARKLDRTLTDMGDNENSINILRESIDRDKTVEINIKFPYSDIFSSRELDEIVKDYFGFFDYFPRFRAGYESLEGPYFYLGAGTGFITKTLIYSIFDEDDAIEIAAEILENKFRKIKRKKDKIIGIVPKTIKEVSTYYDKNAEVGLCLLKR